MKHCQRPRHSGWSIKQTPLLDDWPNGDPRGAFARWQTKKKPFDVLAKGLVSKDSRGNWQSFERMVEEYAETYALIARGGSGVASKLFAY